MSDEIRELLKRVDEDALGTRCLTMAEVTLCLRELKRLTSERTYSHAEMLANQAAALREAAEAIADVPYAATTKEYVKAIFALTTDQLALDRHDAELVAPIKAALERDRTKVAECLTAVKNELHSYSWLIDSRGSYEWDDDRWHDEFKRAHEAITKSIEPMVKIAADWSNCPKTWAEVQKARAELQAKGCKCVCHEYHEHMKLQDALEALKWHQDQIAELKAQTAAMLEKAATHAAVFHQGEWCVACVCGWKSDKCNEYSFYPKFKEHMLSVIPTDYAAALAERDKKIHYEGSCWMLDSIRASLQGYPDHGGDIEVMKEVDRIVREAVRTDRENLCSWLAGDPNWPEGKIVAENILTMTAEENALLAAHRAAAGAPEEKKA